LAEKYEATIGYCLSTAVLNWGCEKGLLGVWTFLIIQKQYIKWCKGCKNYFYLRTGCGLKWIENRCLCIWLSQSLDYLV